MNHIEELHNILNKYEIRKPVPEAIKNKISETKKETLKSILKKKGEYTLFITLVMSLFWWAKRAGITLSLTKSTAVVTATVVVSAGVVTTGTVITVKKVIEKIQETQTIQAENKTAQKDSESSGSAQKSNISTSSKNKRINVIRYAVAVAEVEMPGAQKELINSYTQIIINELHKINGTLAAIAISKSRIDRFSKKILISSIFEIGEAYIINAKVLNTEDSRILYSTTKTVDSKDKIPHVLQTIAKKIAVHIKN